MTEFIGHSRNIQKGQKRLASEAPFCKDTGMLKIKVRPNKDQEEHMQTGMLLHLTHRGGNNKADEAKA